MNYLYKSERKWNDFFPDMEHVEEDPERVKAWLSRDPLAFPWEKTGPFNARLGQALDLLVPFCRSLYVRRLDGQLPYPERKEFKVKVKESSEVTISLQRRNSIPQGMISELMILANSAAADFMSRKGILAVYRAKGSSDPDNYSLWRGSHAELTVNDQRQLFIRLSDN